MPPSEPIRYASEVDRDQLFQALIAKSFDVVAIVDEDARFLYVSPSVEQVLGYAPAELIGRESIDFMRPELRDMLLESHRETVRKRDFRGLVEAETLHKDGSWRVMEFAIQNRMDDPDVGGIVVNYREMTNRKKWQQALEESEERYQKAFRSSPDGIAISRISDGVFLDVNEGFEKITGFARDDMIGRSSLSLNHWKNPEDRDRLTALVRAQGNVREFQAEFLAHDGSARVGQLSVEIVDFDGEKCMLSSIRDITEHVIAQQSLERATEELREEHARLAEKNDMLQNLLRRLQEAKSGFRHDIASSIDNLLRPFLGRLRSGGGRLDSDDVALLDHRLQMIASSHVAEHADNMDRLTPRERGICELIRGGLSSRQIAHELGLSPETVNKHRQSIRRKLQIDHRGINLTTFLRS